MLLKRKIPYFVTKKLTDINYAILNHRPNTFTSLLDHIEHNWYHIEYKWPHIRSNKAQIDDTIALIIFKFCLCSISTKITNHIGFIADYDIKYR